MPELSEIAPSTQPTFETKNLGNKEFLRCKPETIRIDPSTGEAVRPLLYVHGINGDDRLPNVMEALARAGQREVIAVRTLGNLPGSARIVTVNGINPYENAVPEVDALQAVDMIKALLSEGIEEVDAVGESRGANRLVVALAQNPDMIRNVYLAHPAGQDNTTSLEAHLSAANQGVTQAAKKLLGRAERPDIEKSRLMRSKHWFRGLWQKRKEQKSVARAQLHNVLDNISQKYPDKKIIIAGDVSDKAIRADRLEANKGSHVQFIRTNWGMHGIKSQQAVHEITESFKQAEQLNASEFALAA
jgi:pimeloyl-ACP methyl ester carboxylesterase